MAQSIFSFSSRKYSPRSCHWFEKEPAGHSFWPGQFFLTRSSAGKAVEKAGQNRRGVCYLSALHARVLGGVSTRTDRAPTVATRTPGLDEVVEDALAARFVQSLFFHSRSLLSFFTITMSERLTIFSLPPLKSFFETGVLLWS